MINKANRWQSPDTYGKWTFSRDYLGADKPEFKNASFLTVEIEGQRHYLHRGPPSIYKPRSLGKMENIFFNIGKGVIDTVQNTVGAVGDALGTKKVITSEAVSGNVWQLLSQMNGQTCTPNNCSKFFWTKETVLSDKDYFTLKAYNVKH